MKQALITVAIFATLTTTLHAECSKAEVMKLIDKGFSKDEIASICDISSKSTTTKSVKKDKWITPTNKVCRANGGEILHGRCVAEWSDAKAICRASRGRLPSKEELVQVIDACDGNLANTEDAWAENRENPNFLSCCRGKGFFADGSSYWSSTASLDRQSFAWFVDFYFGIVNDGYKDNKNYVRCIKKEQ